MELSIPAGVAWSIFVGVAGSIAGAYVYLVKTAGRVDRKVDEIDCAKTHSELRAEMVAQGKDLEYVVRQHGGEPTPKPSNGGGHSK